MPASQLMPISPLPEAVQAVAGMPVGVEAPEGFGEVLSTAQQEAAPADVQERSNDAPEAHDSPNNVDFQDGAEGSQGQNEEISEPEMSDGSAQWASGLSTQSVQVQADTQLFSAIPSASLKRDLSSPPLEQINGSLQSGASIETGHRSPGVLTASIVDSTSAGESPQPEAQGTSVRRAGFNPVPESPEESRRLNPEIFRTPVTQQETAAGELGRTVLGEMQRGAEGVPSTTSSSSSSSSSSSKGVRLTSPLEQGQSVAAKGPQHTANASTPSHQEFLSSAASQDPTQSRPRVPVAVARAEQLNRELQEGSNVQRQGSSQTQATAPEVPQQTGPVVTSVLGAGGSQSATTAQQLPVPVTETALPAPETEAPQTVRGVARGLNALSQQKGGTLLMRLDPPSLGTVRMEVHIEHGRVSVEIAVVRESARALLAGNMDVLRSALEERGLAVERLVVDSAAKQSADGTNRGEGREQSQSGSRGEDPDQGKQDASQGRSGGRRNGSSSYEGTEATTDFQSALEDA